MSKSSIKTKKKTRNKTQNQDLEESLEDDRLLPYLLQHSNKQNNNNSTQPLPSHLQHVPNDIITKGYSIVPSVFTKQECDAALNQLWDFVQDTSGNMVQRNNPESWYPKHQLSCYEADSANDYSTSDVNDGEDVKERKEDDVKNNYENEIIHSDNDPWPHTGYSSFPDMFQSLGAGYLLGQTRIHMSERIFEPLLNTKELHVSKEGFTFSRPTLFSLQGKGKEEEENDDNDNLNDGKRTYRWNRSNLTRRVCGQIQENSLGEHYDQSHHVKGLQTIQSSVCFIDQNEECGDGHFACIPYSHSDVHTSMTKDIYRGKFSWVPLTETEISSLCNDGNDCNDDRESNKNTDRNDKQIKHIYVKAGDVILWRSDLIHAAVPPKDETFNFRAVGYFSMSPAKWTPNYPNVWNDKMNSYKWGKTGDHRSFVESWHDHKRIQQQQQLQQKFQSTRKDSDNVNWIIERQRPYFRYAPPKITKRLAELYGLLPYDLAKDEETQKALERATIRGVRFVENLDDILSSNTSTARHLNSLPSQPLCTAYSQQLTLANNGLLLGQDKYLGEVCSPDGSFIYGVPGHAKRVLRVNTSTNEMDFIGPIFPGEFKWLRGVEIPAEVMEGAMVGEYPKGCCIALPSNQRSILKINCHTQEVTTFGKTCEEGWLYHGGNLTVDGFVYAIPANATRVLKIDPRNDTIEYIGPTFEGVQKWFGGILGSDGCVYGIPQNAARVLKINPFTQECSLIGKDLGDGKWKWHGGTSINGGKQILGFPNNEDCVLVIDVEKQQVFTIGDSNLLKSGRHRIPQDGRYKWLGGAVTLNGRFSYLFPCDAERVLRIDNETFELSLVGPELLEGENKYQNGFVSKDGCVYGIPQRASGVLRVIPGYLLGNEVNDQVDVLYCGDEMVNVKDKFEGGVIDPKKGEIYCIPLRAKTLMKVVPTENVSIG